MVGATHDILNDQLWVGSRESAFGVRFLPRERREMVVRRTSASRSASLGNGHSVLLVKVPHRGTIPGKLLHEIVQRGETTIYFRRGNAIPDGVIVALT
jgi:hypothetical protein